MPQFLKAGADCLHSTLKRHREFHITYGISAFYGDQSDFAKLPYADKREYLRDLGIDPTILEQLKPISCVGLALRCLGEAFTATGQVAPWNRLSRFTRANAQDGTALQFGLQKLGWKIFYWNPDVRYNQYWDQIEQQNDPDNRLRSWGYHEYRWIMLQRTGKYYMNPVDDAHALVNFGSYPPRSLREIPFFIGTAHTGYHVFPGAAGQVIEGHSVRDITAHDMIESAPFNPMQPGSGPNGTFRSGLLALPPGFDFVY